MSTYHLQSIFGAFIYCCRNQAPHCQFHPRPFPGDRKQFPRDLLPLSALLPLRGGRLFRRFEFRLIAHIEEGGGAGAHAEEMGIVLVKQADRHAAGLKAEPAVIARFTQDKEGLGFDHFLAQGKPEQFRPDPLSLKIGCHGHGGEVQTADLVTMIGIGKGNVADDLAGMNTDPFLQRPVVFVELLHQFDFVGTAGKGPLQQGVNLGEGLFGYFLYFHVGRP